MPDPRMAAKVAPKLHDILVSTVIPKFLEMLQLRDATATIDAMGCRGTLPGESSIVAATMCWPSKVIRARCTGE
jgi:predicted transposase YbfD/YdcC